MLSQHDLIHKVMWLKEMWLKVMWLKGMDMYSIVLDSRFSLKSFKPASCSSPFETAGNHPIMALESTEGGGFEINDKPKAGSERDIGVGGERTW